MTLRARYAHTHWVLKLIQWIALVLLLMGVAVGLWMLHPAPQSTAGLKFFQLLQTLAVFLLPPIVLAFLWQEHPAQWLHIDRLPRWQAAALAVAMVIVAMPGINLLSWINRQMVLPDFLAPLEQWMQTQEDNAALLTERFLQTDSVWGVLMNLGLMALLPALAEELTFRGLLQNTLTPPPAATAPAGAIWITAILFSAIHIQFYGFVPRMLLGALFGYALCWSRSLWLPVVMHFTNNALAVLTYSLCPHENLSPTVFDTLGTPEPLAANIGNTLWIGILSLVLTLAAIPLLKRLAISAAHTSTTPKVKR